jgi:hypothetical protein
MLGSRRSEKPNPVGRKLQELEETSHELAEKMAELEAQLRASNQPLPPGLGPRETAVWRNDPDEPAVQGEEPTTRRGLRRQQARDRNMFIVLFFVLTVVLLWLYQKIAAVS